MRAPRQHELALRPRSRRRTQPETADLDAGLRALLGEEERAPGDAQQHQEGQHNG